MPKKNKICKGDIYEDYCFACKDGGNVRICDYKDCPKVYHPECVEKDDSFLQSQVRWACDRHSCFICHKTAKYHCLCCPQAVCKHCLYVADFVLVKGSDGFCNECLKLAILIEENLDVDSDGGRVDFKERNTMEFLFKEYWEIIKEKQSLCEEHVKVAKISMKYKNIKCDFDSKEIGRSEDSCSEADGASDYDGLNSGEECMLVRKRKRPKGKLCKTKRKVKAKKIEFTGWGSKPLLQFLSSIGKDTTEQLSEDEVTKLVKNYCKVNNLFDPEKRKTVICDTILQSLLGKKSFSISRIHNLLTVHFSDNLELSEDDETGSSSEDKDEMFMGTCKNLSKLISDRQPQKREVVSAVQQNSFASIVPENIKLVYLKRSLVEELLKQPETYNDKVVGSFVRVKSAANDPKKTFHQLFLVRGKILKNNATNTEIFLQLFNMEKDVPISKLSDEELCEEECIDLHQRMKDGLLKTPTVVELEHKAKQLHTDIMKHWIAKELSLLQKRIDQANEKRWRTQLEQYINNKERLEKPAVQLQLLNKVPKVIADIGNFESTPENSPAHEKPERGGLCLAPRGSSQSFRTALANRTFCYSKGRTDQGGREKLGATLENSASQDKEIQHYSPEASGRPARTPGTDLANRTLRYSKGRTDRAGKEKLCATLEKYASQDNEKHDDSPEAPRRPAQTPGTGLANGTLRYLKGRTDPAGYFCNPLEMENNTEDHVVGMCVIPAVRDDFKPKLGLNFGSLDEVYMFYNKYAELGGFGIKKDSTKKLRGTDVVARKEYRCYKGGHRERPEGAPTKRLRGCSRTNCQAKIAVLLDIQSSKYSVVTFVEEHNHEMTSQDRVHLLLSHRNVPETKKAVLHQLSSVNVPIYQQASLLALQSGGLGNKNVERVKVSGHDAWLLQEHFKAQKKKNASFYWCMEVDAENRMGNVFWADARSIREYEYFGDVLVFDTTFNTNRYGMSFAPIVGVNNHQQTQLLASAFLKNESFESFCWLFDQLKKAMPDGPPKMIITNLDLAIAKAIKVCLPSTFHKFCIWHIINKFGEKKAGDTFFELMECIWEIDTKEEYDAKWSQIVTENGLEGNDWLAEMHNLRHIWVPAYVKHVFSAGMSSSQRAETCHAFFKKCISRKNTLMEFIVRFDRAVASQRHRQLEADCHDKDQEPPQDMRMLTPMCSQMATIYTRRIFDIFHLEQVRSFHCFLFCQNEDNTRTVYKVEERVTSGILYVKDLVYDKVNDRCFCSCKGLEFCGIPCRHILAYLRLKQVMQLPEKYILKRWTQSAKTGLVRDKEGNEIKDVPMGDVLVKRTSFCKDALDLIDEALLTNEGSIVVAKTLTELRGKLISLRPSEALRNESNQALGTSGSTLKDPVKPKTRGVNKRIKGKREMTGTKRMQNKCSGCKQPGHDIRMCPEKEKRSSPSDTESLNQEWETVDESESSSSVEDSDRSGDFENTQTSPPSQHGSIMHEFDGV